MFAGHHPVAIATPSADAPGFTVLWFAVVVAAVIIALVIGARLRDRTYYYYAGYVGAMGVMSLCNHVLEGWQRAHWGEPAFVCINNFLHLPYAVFYLLFVMRYFNVAESAPGWARFHRGLLGAYGLTLGWWAVDCLRGGAAGSEWAILGCNLVNLLSSLVLAGVATHDHRPGAREFLYASVPLTMSGLVLVAQFLAGTGPGQGPSLVAFRTGFILHLMVFLLALSVRHRGLRGPQVWHP